MIVIEKNEQYALIDPVAESIDKAISDDIEKKVAGLYREGYSNFILDFKNVNDIAEPGISLIKKIEKISKNENGILVITTENEELVELLDTYKMEELVIMATKEEAIEAIYLNELENDFREEEDESADEFGEDPSADYE
ncbi:MAG: STAS domain-containing protein [Bacteroidota bacterium]